MWVKVIKDEVMRIQLTNTMLVREGREYSSRVKTTENVMQPDKVLETTTHCDIWTGKLLKRCLFNIGTRIKRVSNSALSDESN
jgi:hypothetical protein